MIITILYCLSSHKHPGLLCRAPADCSGEMHQVISVFNTNQHFYGRTLKRFICLRYKVTFICVSWVIISHFPGFIKQDVSAFPA